MRRWTALTLVVVLIGLLAAVIVQLVGKHSG